MVFESFVKVSQMMEIEGKKMRPPHPRGGSLDIPRYPGRASGGSTRQSKAGAVASSSSVFLVGVVTVTSATLCPCRQMSVVPPRRPLPLWQ